MTVTSHHLSHSESNLFDAYKSIGHVTEPTPFAFTIGKLTKDSRIYTSIGNAYHNYLMSNLVLADTGPQLDGKINCIYAERKDDNAIIDWVYLAVNQSVLVYNQRELIATMENGHSRPITHMLKMGKYLLTFSRDDHRCVIWDTSNDFTLVQIQKIPSDSTITCVIHPHAYLDKILIGTEEGHLDLFNIRVGELVHRFSAFEKVKSAQDDVVTRMILRTEDEKKSFASVTALSNSPALDVIAVGLGDGQIVLHNLRYDKSLFKLVHSPGPVTALSFRTDNVFSLASGNGIGEIAIWDLEKRSLIQLLPNAHSEAITSLLFVPHEPVLVSSAADNSLQTFIMDRPDKPRMQNKKEGHSKPPQHVKFYDPMGNWLISSGSDRQMRLTSLVDRVTSQISQRLKKKKKNTTEQSEEYLRLPAVSGFDTNYLRQDDWENLISCHEGSNVARLWVVKNMAISKKSLYAPINQFGTISSLCLSTCGNMAIIGRSKGFVEKWNVQSGQLKGYFTEYVPTGDKDIVTKRVGHQGAVNGVVVDNTNAKVVTGGYDSVLKIWDLKSGKLLNQFALGASITKIVKSKVSNLIAVSTDNFEIFIYDLNTDILIRNHQKHEHPINDMTFSFDSRILVSCCKGNYIIAYDIVTARVIDWLKVPKMAVSLDFHPEGLYLASCHADTVGISLWINKLVFGYATIQSVSAPMHVNLPMTSQEAEKIQTEEEEKDEALRSKHIIERKKRKREVMQRVNQVESDEDSDDEEELDGQNGEMLDEDFGKKAKSGDFESRLQSKYLATFSGLPKNKWYSIMHLDELRERNKNAIQNEMDSAAPFVLNTVKSVTGKMNFVKSDEPQSKILGDIYSKRIQSEKDDEEEDEIMTNNYSSSELMALIKESKSNGYIQANQKIKEMSPKDLDVAIRLMNVGDDYQEYKDLIDYMTDALKKRKNFDLVQALLNLFLQVHSELISKATDLSLFDKIDQLLEAQALTWNPLDSSMQNSLCLSKFVQGLY